MQRHYNIPIFLPELACPFRCVFCDQQKITGIDTLPDSKAVEATISKHLSTIPRHESTIEIAFFGGNFTGLAKPTQHEYLSVAQHFVDKYSLNGIRLSTRPDYIDPSVLTLLAGYSVSTIELGAQSLDDEVLACSGRGHSVRDVERASKLIKEAGFMLGLQMMIGLPGDNPQKAMATAEKIAALGAAETRIYPCLVIQGTALHKMYLRGDYIPVSMEEAVAISADLLLYFEERHVSVIRLGLFASEDLKSGAYIAGPFHNSFKELVMSEVWRRNFAAHAVWPPTEQITIEVAPAGFNFAVGYKASNKKHLLKRYKQVKFMANPSLNERNFNLIPVAP